MGFGSPVIFLEQTLYQQCWPPWPPSQPLSMGPYEAFGQHQVDPGFLRCLSGKEYACQAGDAGLIPGSKDPWRREWQPTPVFLPGKSHGQRSLVGCSPWGHKKSDMTEWLSNRWIMFQVPPGSSHENEFSCSCQEVVCLKSCHTGNVFLFFFF